MRCNAAHDKQSERHTDAITCKVVTTGAGLDINGTPEETSMIRRIVAAYAVTRDAARQPLHVAESILGA
jgi:hypothetical protein